MLPALTSSNEACFSRTRFTRPSLSSERNGTVRSYQVDRSKSSRAMVTPGHKLGASKGQKQNVLKEQSDRLYKVTRWIGRYGGMGWFL